MVFGLFNTGPTKAEQKMEDDAKKAADDANRFSEEMFNYSRTVGKTERKTLVDQQDIEKRAHEQNNLIQEGQMIRNYEDERKIQDFELNQAYRFHNQSVFRADAQRDFNEIAEIAAREQQAVKFQEDMLGLAFDKGQSILDYYGNSTGLKVNRHNALVQADFKEAESKNRFEYGMAQASQEKRKAISESQIRTQQAILEGMKAAGAMKAKGGAGRSAVKTVLGVMAESGAMKAGIANALMYAENAIDLSVAQLKDIQILDQTMVAAARNQANMDHDFGMQKLDSGKAMDDLIFKATEQSINRRNELVKKQITNSRMQADLKADAMVHLEPERTPEIRAPWLTFMHDNPETEDWFEMVPRAEFVEIPEYIEPPRPPEQLPSYRAPESQFSWGNFLTTVGTVATTIATAGAAAPGSILGMGATQAQYVGAIGAATKTIGGYVP